jgi:hypothetical protein
MAGRLLTAVAAAMASQKTLVFELGNTIRDLYLFGRPPAPYAGSGEPELFSSPSAARRAVEELVRRRHWDERYRSPQMYPSRSDLSVEEISATSYRVAFGANVFLFVTAKGLSADNEGLAVLAAKHAIRCFQAEEEINNILAWKKEIDRAHAEFRKRSDDARNAARIGDRYPEPWEPSELWNGAVRTLHSANDPTELAVLYYGTPEQALARAKELNGGVAPKAPVNRAMS